MAHTEISIGVFFTVKHQRRESPFFYDDINPEDDAFALFFIEQKIADLASNLGKRPDDQRKLWSCHEQDRNPFLRTLWCAIQAGKETSVRTLCGVSNFKFIDFSKLGEALPSWRKIKEKGTIADPESAFRGMLRAVQKWEDTTDDVLCVDIDASYDDGKTTQTWDSDEQYVITDMNIFRCFTNRPSTRAPALSFVSAATVMQLGSMVKSWRSFELAFYGKLTALIRAIHHVPLDSNDAKRIRADRAESLADLLSAKTTVYGLPTYVVDIALHVMQRLRDQYIPKRRHHGYKLKNADRISGSLGRFITFLELCIVAGFSLYGNGGAACSLEHAERQLNARKPIMINKSKSAYTTLRYDSTTPHTFAQIQVVMHDLGLIAILHISDADHTLIRYRGTVVRIIEDKKNESGVTTTDCAAVLKYVTELLNSPKRFNAKIQNTSPCAIPMSKCANSDVRHLMLRAMAEAETTVENGMQILSSLKSE